MKYDFNYFHKNLLVNQNVQYEEYKDKTEFDIFLFQLRTETIYDFTEIDWSLFVAPIIKLGLQRMGELLFEHQLQFKFFLYLQLHLASICKEINDFKREVPALEKECARHISLIMNDHTPVHNHSIFHGMPALDYYKYMQSPTIFKEKTPLQQWIDNSREIQAFEDFEENMFPPTGALSSVEDWHYGSVGCFYYVRPGYFHKDGIYFLPKPLTIKSGYSEVDLSLKLYEKLKKYTPLASGYAAIYIADKVLNRQSDYDFDDVKDYIECHVESYLDDNWAALFEILDAERAMFTTFRDNHLSSLLESLLQKHGIDVITVIRETREYIRHCIDDNYINEEVLTDGKIDFVKALWAKDAPFEDEVDQMICIPSIMRTPEDSDLQFICEEEGIPQLLINNCRQTTEAGKGFIACLFNMEHHVAKDDMRHRNAEYDILSWDWRDEGASIEHPTLIQRTAHYFYSVEDCSFSYRCKVSDLFRSYTEETLRRIDTELEQSPRNDRARRFDIMRNVETAGIKEFLSSPLYQWLSEKQQTETKDFLIGLLEYWEETYSLEIAIPLALLVPPVQEGAGDLFGDASDNLLALLDKARAAGLLGSDYMPAEGLVQADIALLANELALRCSIPNKWKYFEQKWNIPRLANAYQKAQNRQSSVGFIEKMIAALK